MDNEEDSEKKPLVKERGNTELSDVADELVRTNYGTTGNDFQAVTKHILEPSLSWCF